MSEEKSGLTTGFTTEAERRKNEPHEFVYSDKNLTLPTLVLVGCSILGFVLAVMAMP